MTLESTPCTPSAPSPFRFTFLGSTDSVDGSMHLLDTGRHRLLLDCGKCLDSKRNPQSQLSRVRLRNQNPFPFDPSSIDAVLLTHAHVDHCANLPLLVKHGFHGLVFSSAPTRDLTEIVLHDSARIFEKELGRRSQRYASTSSRSPGHEFSHRDVDDTMELFVDSPMDEWISFRPEIRLRLHSSGHVLGSTMFEMELTHKTRQCRMIFTGDVGRNTVPFLSPPATIPETDLLICESTYGGREHEPFQKTLDALARIIETITQRDGKVLIPAFSLGRFDLVRKCLALLRKDNRISRSIPIFLDSPLSMSFDDVYRDFGHGLDDYLSEIDLTEHRDTWIEDSDDAWYRTTSPGPAIIIASGGMCEGGRILDHLRYHIDDPRSCILFVSYQAQRTLGAQLLEPSPVIRFGGRVWNKWIDVQQLTGFSAHGDQSDLVQLCAPMRKDTTIRLVHGDAEQKLLFQSRLQSLGFTDVAIPTLGQSISL